MIYKKFRIRNFKGVRDTTVSLPDGNTNVTTLIGLNESGKTTILEAIYSFSPDRESEPLFLEDNLIPDQTAKIPRDKLFSFSDEISVTATVSFAPDEKISVVKAINAAISGQIDPTCLSDTFTIKDKSVYVNSEFSKKSVVWDLGGLRVKTGKQQKWRTQTGDEWSKIWAILREALPSVAYFPTFLSQIPNRIYLKSHDDDKVNTFYRTIFQDILYQIGPDFTIESQILSRLTDKDEEKGVISQIIAAFWGSSRRGMVQQLIDKASAVLSQVITDRWNEIFKTRPAGREIVINFGIDENPDDATIDPYIEFAIRDGTNRFNIADRSLGFRWFFCFLLFTQFRAKRQNGSATLFLFDEPASNLHAKAQEKLLDSFKEVSQSPNTLIYSTHSPYMIEPLWLDDAYVIENALISSELKDIGEMSVSEESDIAANKYKSYVQNFPDRLNHFQPVLDRLEVKPSLSEISEKTLLVEGKSDYAILKGLTEGKKLGFKIIPAHGATTLGPLVALLRGWGWSFAVLLDSDAEGLAAAKRYRQDFSLNTEVVTLEDAFAGLKQIEYLLTDKDKDTISKHSNITGKLTKKSIYAFFIANSGNIKSYNLDAQNGQALKDLIALLEGRFT